MADDIDRTFDWHSAAIKGQRGPIDADNPKSGFYRTKSGRNGPYVPVAFWYDSKTDELRCHKDGRSIEDRAARELWIYAAKNPIAPESYWHKIDTGTWADNDAAAGAGPDIDPEQDPVGSLKAEIEAALIGVPTYKGIESDEQAARGQTLRAALTTLSGKADKTRATEKEPHLQASRDVDAKWMPLVKLAKQGADDIRAELGRWEDIKRENLKRAAETNAKPETTTPVIPNTPPPATVIKGATGRAASVQIKKVVTAIDLENAWQQFGKTPEVYNLLMELSQKAVDAGILVPGATIEERSNIR